MDCNMFYVIGKEVYCGYYDYATVRCGEWGCPEEELRELEDELLEEFAEFDECDEDDEDVKG